MSEMENEMEPGYKVLFEYSVDISARPAAAFAAIADPKVQMTFDQDFEGEKLTEGPIGRGTRFRGRIKGLGSADYEYSEFESGHLIEHATKTPMGRLRYRFEFSAAPAGTRLVQRSTGDLNLLGVVILPLMKGRVEARMRVLNSRIKTYAEGLKATP